LIIEDYYSGLRNSWSPMDIEWAKDGVDQQLYIVQARPETLHSQNTNKDKLVRYHLDTSDTTPTVLTKGHSIGQKISSGVARLLSVKDADSFNEGDILVTPMTDPDWVPLMKKASAIITDNGGRTCHAAIVSRELGVPALVGTGDATKKIREGQPITLDCSQGAIGYVYDGIIPFNKKVTELTALPEAPVDILVNIANPDSAYEHSFLPVAGVGLARLEFIITNFITVHPMAICHQEKIKDPALKAKIDALASAYDSWESFFIDTLACGVATIAAAFYPRPVVVRLTDFKSNEYRNLLGGPLFEPVEENPMLGFRGAVRYCNPAYAPAFALECAALKKARVEMGFTNIKIMVPFVRTLSEASCTIDSLKNHGLVRGRDDLELLMMCEIPSNILLLEEFAHYFDSFSIGSNDLAQLTLGVDRDSGLLSHLFDERDPAVLKFLLLSLEKAKKSGIPMSICGQAPSDFPEIADLLIQNGINALSLNPDSVIPFILRFKR
jgi:pyruvate,water dikinase